MKIATTIAAWTTWLANDRSLESSITTASMIGAKIAPRLSVRLHDGGCTVRPPREAGAGPDDALRVGTSSASSVSACAMAWRDYARLLQAISPPCTTVCTTGPPRWYAR